MQLVNGSKYLWQLPIGDKNLISDLVLSHNLSFPVVQTLVGRGYVTKKSIEDFLFVSREKSTADPRLLKDAEKAVDRIIKAVKNKEKILICGDYDVDGITSSAMMMLCLLPLGADVNFFLPHRVRDGYGLKPKIVERAKDNGYKVIVTVDNGISSFEAAEKAKEFGIDLIITDHHKVREKIPEAFAVIDPCQNECKYPYKKLAGVGVTFKIISLLYEKLKKEIPNQVYELLTLGTIADVVPLTGENRFWVRNGLEQIAREETPAFQVLKKNARLTNSQISSLDIGYAIAPQINALGRLQDARSGVKFLVGGDLDETERVGKVLYELNQARKMVEKSVLEDVERDIETGKIDPEKDAVIIASSSRWSPGVIGLVASRLVSKYGRPTILFHKTKDGLLRGSCRSIPEFNIFDALSECSDILKNFGGHPMAAGLSLPENKLPELKMRLTQIIRRDLTEEDLKQKLVLDAELELSDANTKLMTDLKYLEPFGCENKRPLFLLKNVTILEEPVLLKDEHVKFKLFSGGVIRSVIFFGRPDIMNFILRDLELTFDVAAHAVENNWEGRTRVEFHGVDIARSAA